MDYFYKYLYDKKLFFQKFYNQFIDEFMSFKVCNKINYFMMNKYQRSHMSNILLNSEYDCELDPARQDFIFVGRVYYSEFIC